MSSSVPTTSAVATLADVERVVGSWCEQTDPALHRGADAVMAVERLARVIKKLTAKQAGSRSGSMPVGPSLARRVRRRISWLG